MLSYGLTTNKKRKQKSLQIEIEPGILLHQLQHGLKNHRRIFLTHHTFFMLSAVWIATEFSERKVIKGSSKITHRGYQRGL